MRFKVRMKFITFFQIISTILLSIEFAASFTVLICSFSKKNKYISDFIFMFEICSIVCNVLLTVLNFTGSTKTIVQGNLYLDVILIVSLICSILIIAKGTKMISESAARLTLDALPNKMLSIDNNFRNNRISEGQSQKLKKELQANMDFLARIDGLSNFNFVIAIVTVFISLANIVGGIIIEKNTAGATWLDAINLSVILSTKNTVLFVIPQMIVLFSIIFCVHINQKNFYFEWDDIVC